MHRIVHVQQREVGKSIRFECLDLNLFLLWFVDRSGALTIRSENSSSEQMVVKTFADGSWISVWGTFGKQVYCSDVPPST